MAATPRLRMTEAEYVAFEERATERHEFLDGELFAMSGGTAAHDAICLALGAELRAALEGRPCRAHGQAMRIKVERSGLYTYPDASIVCGERRFQDDRRLTLLNPNAIFELLSPTTEAYDRGEKFAHYRAIESMSEYVLLASHARRVEVFSREGDGWVMHVFESGETARLPNVDVAISVDAIYRGIELAPAPTPPDGR